MLKKLLALFGFSEAEDIIVPTSVKGQVYRVDKTKADCRYMSDHPNIIAREVTRIYMLQLIGSSSVYDNAAILLNDVDKSVVIVSWGNLSFHSTHGGELAANKFYAWLVENQLLAKISPAFMHIQDYNSASNTLELDMDSIKLTGYPLSEKDIQIYLSNFNKWKQIGYWTE